MMTSVNRLTVLFAIFFMTVTVAPSIIISLDNNVDVTCFYGDNEEENLQYHFEILATLTENSLVSDTETNTDSYTFKSYPKPYLNSVFPPPDNI